MAAKRISPSIWLTLALAVVVDVAGCEGKSKTSGDDDDDANAGSGASEDGGTGGTTGGKGAASGTGGKGGTSTGGRGGTSGGAGDAGSPVGGESQGGESQGGQPQGGAGGDPGDGGDAGGGGFPDTTVVGRVVDFWLQPLANVPVTIGAVSVATNAQGVFTVSSVAPEYDVSLVVSWLGGQAGEYGWRFEGLTRRDPTLQVYKGRQNRSADYTFDPQGETLNASRTLWFTIAGPNGANYNDDVSGTGFMTSASWDGPATTQVSAHALLWEFDSNELPTVYRSYDSASLTLDEAATTSTLVTLNLADETISSGSVSGTVTAPSSSERANYALVRFAGGAAIRVVNDYPAANAYNYVVPTLPRSSITVAAAEGNSYFGEFAIAHRDGLAAGQSGVTLAIPDPVTQVVPASTVTGVNATTQFSWSGSAGPCIFHVESVRFYNGLYVVTNRRTITLPSIPGVTLRAAEVHNWRVERHGSAASVDELAGPQGYLDPFSVGDDFAEGPRTGDGTFSISTGRTFTTAN